MKKYVEFKDLQIGDKFRLKFGRTVYVKVSETFAETNIQIKSIYKNQDVEKL